MRGGLDFLALFSRFIIIIKLQIYCQIDDVTYDF